MRLIAFDLDDTLMVCGEDYTDAMDEFGTFIAERADVSVERAVETLTKFDHKNVEKFGLSMKRFPQSFVDAYDFHIDEPVADDRVTVRAIGESVFKTEAEYAARGFMEGVIPLLNTLLDHGFDLHLITAGDDMAQRPKLDGLRLKRFFTEMHVVPLDGKADCLRDLMARHEYTPEETYLVGNSLTSDIKAALDAGGRGVYIPTHEWLPTENREYYEQHERVSIYENLDALHIDCPTAFLQGSSASLA